MYGGAPGLILPTQSTDHVSFFTNSNKNVGPFRLYFSPDSMVNHLSTPPGETDIYGVPYQLYAQGYQPSASLSGSLSVSSTHPSILQMGTNGLQTSGYYYGSSIMDPGTHKRVMLDESAANTFANAKHAANSMSGKSKLVTIYTPHTGIGGEAAASTGNTRGRGFKSANVFDLNREN